MVALGLHLWVPAAARAVLHRPIAGGATVAYVVRPGDTLWGIASRVAPGTDPRVVVDRLASVNGLGGRDLVPGQVLRVPRSA
ncbi:MAG TPA: LysM peptidoglycan-binding domain-containing protein [Actinomycetota bacterium]|nr:LysM peptidoglycan-binding domain-containing protein [Actinomycetota bacterium]